MKLRNSFVTGVTLAAGLVAGTAVAAEQGTVDIYSAKDLSGIGQKLAQKQTPAVSQDLKRYGNHYTMVAHREATGSAEVHEHEADFFFVESGSASILTGGKVANPKTEKPGEIRGSAITGGERHAISVGDVVHIPAGVPHQLQIEKGKPFTYFVVKVTGQ